MKKIWLGLLLLFTFGQWGSAQSVGTINGRITDPSGAVIPGAAVTATNAGTGITRNTVTTAEGQYTIPSLTPGSYSVKVEAPGFAAMERKGATLITGTTLTVDFALNLASTSQSVEVTTAEQMVEVTQSSVSDTLRASEVQNLPILNRNFSGLVTLVPSARPSPPSSTAKISMGGGLGFGGSNGRNGVAEADGATLRDDANGGVLFNVTLEGVQEFNVIAHDYPAQYGLISGGIMLITTKSGTNTVHGSAFGYGRSDAMTAVDYFSNPANGGFGKPPYSREEFGGSIGAPIVKDKLFAFGAVEDLRLNQAIVWSPAATSQAQTLKTALTALTSCSICTTIGKAIVPSSYAPETLRDLQSSVRLDYQVNSQHQLFARWMGEHDNGYDDILASRPDNDPNGSNNLDILRGDNAVVSDTWVINNKSVNTFAFSGNHFFDIQSCNCTLTGAAQIYRNMTFPDLSVGEQTGNTYTEEVVDNFQFKDNFVREAGKHSIKFGGEFIDFPRLGFERRNSGSVSFFDDPSVITTNTTKYPQGFLTPGALKGITESTVNFGGPAAHARVWGGKVYGFFAQDDWKIKKNLTLNLGLRYSLDINFYNEGLQAQNRAYQLLKSISSPYGATSKTPARDISPRVGFVWNPDGKGKNVIRGSYGVYFDESLSVNMISVDPEEQPTLQNISSAYTNTAVGAGQIASTVFGGPLPTTLTPGLTAFLPNSNSSLTWLDPQMTDPYNEQAHIGYTRQLTSSSVLSVDYTHILGMHEIHSEPINPQENVAWDSNAASYNTCGLTGTWRRLQCGFDTATSTAPTSTPTIGAVSLITSSNRSQYDEMIIHFEQRTRPVTLQASYILASAYAFGGAIGATGSAGGATTAELPFQWFTPSEWGPSSTDERNRGVVSGVINLPWHIQASPVFQISSARPYNCVSSSDYTKSGGTARCVMDSSGNLVAPPASLPLPAGQSLVPVNYLRGTATWDLDSRFTKSFTIHESMKLDAFAELYNITNKANFGNTYGGTYVAPPVPSTSSFMKPTGYLNQGLSLPISRQLQLGARFTF